jgi:site-specific DNA-methyltransferase (cytosine-N4-specific)
MEVATFISLEACWRTCSSLLLRCLGQQVFYAEHLLTDLRRNQLFCFYGAKAEKPSCSPECAHFWMVVTDNKFLFCSEAVLKRDPAQFTETSSALVVGNALSVLELLPEGIAQACVTSPPYWYVRDYGVRGQIGLERDLDAYVFSLVQAFRHVRRTLREDGLLWLNIGDGYTSGGRSWRAPDKKNPNRAMATRPPTPTNLKAKDLLGVPWRLALALQQPWLRCRYCEEENHASRFAHWADGTRICPHCRQESVTTETESGWYLRSEIIWYRPNCQPESVKDRVTRSHEHVFMLSKGERYFYDNRTLRGANDRNARSLWSINTEPGQWGHIAPFPEALAANCLALSSREEDLILDPFLGSGTTAVVAQRMGRRFLGVELNREYAAVAKRRLQKAASL